MAQLISIPFTKVYKWNWERKKKDQKQVTLYDLASMYPEVGGLNNDGDDDCEITLSEHVEEEKTPQES